MSEYLHFWRETDRVTGYLSQWYQCYFTDPTIPGNLTFNCTEQYMMYRKAMLAGDDTAKAKIMATDSPREQKAWGRKAKNLDLKEWDRLKYEIVMRGNLLKFGQNAELKEQLLKTGDAKCVEASPYDSIWGIGLTAADAEHVPESAWGENLLGKALDDVRAQLRAEADKAGSKSTG